MHRTFRPRWWAPLAAASLIVGCSSGTVRLQPQSPVGTATSTPSPTSSGTPTGGATATPTGSATATPTASATATPTHGATATPTPSQTATPTPGPTGTGIGSGLNCTAPVAMIPGNYLSIFTQGQVSGSTYTADPAAYLNAWEDDAYTVATPAPTPSPTATATASTTPTPMPTVTPTPNMYSIYVGTFTVSAFNGTAIPETGTTPAPYSVQAQTGCFFLLLEQPVGGTIGQSRHIAAATPNPADNAFGDGTPNTTSDYNTTEIATGTITSLSINNLSATKATGSGSFVLDTGATGTIAIQGATTETFGTRRLIEQARERELRTHVQTRR